MCDLLSPNHRDPVLFHFSENSRLFFHTSGKCSGGCTAFHLTENFSTLEMKISQCELNELMNYGDFRKRLVKIFYISVVHENLGN